MADLEQALFLHSLPDQPPSGYQRLYAGAEFCPWRLPAPEFLSEALAWARRAGWAFTLVTPVLIEPCRDRFQAVLAALLPQLAAGDELLISDWGSLELARAILPTVPVVLGRTLSGQKRGPRILDLDLSAEQQHYFRQGSWYADAAAELLGELAIRRVELDNLLQGMAPLPAGLRGSLHLPYAMVSSSRNCPFRQPGRADACPASCGEPFRLTSSETPVPLLQAGNTQFLRNAELPADCAGLGIDRLVHHLELPR